jgi:hypothetical protein
MSREAFGPTLRRRRLRQGVSLQQISDGSKIPVELLAALEANDVSAWPVGIYARAYVRQYAYAIGINDAEDIVEEFCRCFPEGDRRVRRTIVEQATIIGHDSTWTDELPPEAGGIDRRGREQAPPAPVPMRASSHIALIVARLRRTLGRA